MQVKYIKTKINNTVNISEIITVHYYEFDRNFSFDGESHDFWEMVYVDRGKIKVKSGNDELVLGQEEIIFHKPNEFHAVKAHESSPDFFVISFECRSAAMKQLENFHTLLNKKLKPIIASIISEAEKTYVIPKNDVHLSKLVLKDNAPIGGEQLIKTYLEQLFILLIREITSKTQTVIFPTKEKMENHIAESIRQYIESNVREKITLADICDYTGYGKSYLYKIFRFYAGGGICEYVNLTKVNAAKKLIRDGNMNFSEISDYLSFDNPQYFSRVFKRTTGITPTEFKLSLQITDF